MASQIIPRAKEDSFFETRSRGAQRVVKSGFLQVNGALGVKNDNKDYGL